MSSLPWCSTSGARHSAASFRCREAASAPPSELTATADRAFELRDQLMADAKVLAKRGYLDPARIAALSGNTGYKNISTDLGVLVAMMRKRWAEVSSNSGVKAQELDEAEHLAGKLIDAVGAQEQRKGATTAATDDRDRAFTLFWRAYDNARRAAMYLVGTEKADDYVPSLFANRSKSKASDGVPAASDGATTTSSGSAASSSPSVSVDAPTVPGGPGGDPLMS